MSAGSWRELQVALQDRSSGLGIDLFEPHGLATSMPEHDASSTRTHVAHPVRVLTEHRPEIPVALIVGHHDVPRFSSIARRLGRPPRKTQAPVRQCAHDGFRSEPQPAGARGRRSRGSSSWRSSARDPAVCNRWSSDRPDGARARSVLFVYPGIGGPGDDDLLDEWTAIPGARGCTPEACSVRDSLAEFRVHGVDVFGLSAQSNASSSSTSSSLRCPIRSFLTNSCG